MAAASRCVLVLLFLHVTRTDGVSQYPPLSWLSVAERPADAPSHLTRRWIVDEHGRGVTLRGVCVEAEERNLPPPNGAQRPVDPAVYANGKCPANLGEYQEPPICEVSFGSGRFNVSNASLNDFAALRAQGFGIVRLCLSWSNAEPTPGVYDPLFIARVRQMVDWAGEQGVYVILDMHQDIYSRFIIGNGTGYPPWLTPSGVADLNLAAMRAFQAFWDNEVPPGVPQGAAPGPGLQDHYIGAMAALVSEFIDEPTVAGFEIINEPLPGLDLDPWDFSSKYLQPFHRRVIQAMTGVRDGLPTCPANATAGPDCAYPDLGLHDRHLYFFEPCALRNQFDADLATLVPFTNYTNIVYTPHVYTGEFTLIQPPSFEYAYQTATAEADAAHAALFVSEFGSGGDSMWQFVYPTLLGQDAYQVSGTFWSWKTNCVGDGCTNGSWSVNIPAPSNGTGIIAPTGPIRRVNQLLLSRVHLRYVAGTLQSYAYDANTTSFAAVITAAPLLTSAWPAACPASIVFEPAAAACLTALTQAGVLANVTELYVPASIAHNVSVSPTASVRTRITWPDGSLSVFITASQPSFGLSVNAPLPTWTQPARALSADAHAAHQRSALDAWSAHVSLFCDAAVHVEPRLAHVCESARSSLARRRGQLTPSSG